jgi:DUF4097 and DUF4098 domain-containing protein YvlB
MRSTTRRIRPRSPLRWLPFALLALACAPSHARTASSEARDEAFSASPTATDFEWNGKIAKGSRLDVRGVAGTITVKPAKGPTTRVTATKSGENASELDIEVKTGPSGVTIATRQKRQTNDARADFTILLGSGVRLEAHTVSGDIAASGLEGPVVLETVSGSIDVSIRGRLRAKTVSGGVKAHLSDPVEDASLATVNGTVELTLPKAANAQVDASVVNGHIGSEFPALTTTTGLVGSRLSGVLGKGGPKIALEAVNGKIAIRKHG